jgi:hypothetical protein
MPLNGQFSQQENAFVLAMNPVSSGRVLGTHLQKPGGNGAARWTMIWLCLLANTINYFDRANFAVAAPTIRKKLGLDAAVMGVMLSRFFWTHSVKQLPFGWFADSDVQNMSGRRHPGLVRYHAVDVRAEREPRVAVLCDCLWSAGVRRRQQLVAAGRCRADSRALSSIHASSSRLTATFPRHVLRFRLSRGDQPRNLPPATPASPSRRATDPSWPADHVTDPPRSARRRWPPSDLSTGAERARPRMALPKNLSELPEIQAEPRLGADSRRRQRKKLRL